MLGKFFADQRAVKCLSRYGVAGATSRIVQLQKQKLLLFFGFGQGAGPVALLKNDSLGL